MSVTANTPWMILIILLPLLAAVASFLFRRLATLIGLSGSLGTTVLAALLVGQVVQTGPTRYPVGGWGAPLGIDLYIDGLSSLMLAMTAGIGSLVSIYASSYFQSDHAQRNYFWPLWLFLWAALNALFLSADLFNLYVTLELLGLSAVALAALTGSAATLAAAMRYLLVSLLGSLSYLLGVALIYSNYGVLDLVQLHEVIRASPTAWAALALMTAGLLLKTALFPLHFWLPQAHANAPAPVSAVLSALVVKASFYLLLRLWFEVFDSVVTPPAAQLVGILGAVAIFWGSVLALYQSRLKLVVAYSTVAQLGYLFLAFPIVLSLGESAWFAVILFALAHAVAKAAMFLSTGILMYAAGTDRLDKIQFVARRMPVPMLTFALAGISIVGLPPSGGFLAKWLLLQSALASGQWWWALIIMIGSMLAAAYVFRIVACAFWSRTDVRVITATGVWEWSALALAVISVVLGFTALYPLELLVLGGPEIDVAVREATQ